jgi:hypothetical protein
VLQRDDICRFFYPLPTPATTLAMRANPEDVSIVVRHFDGTEQVVLKGSEVQNPLRDLFEMYRANPGHFNGQMLFVVRVSSKTLPKVDMQGKTNPNYVAMAEPNPECTSETC